MIDKEFCEKNFKDPVLAEIIESYKVSSLDEINEIKIRADISSSIFNESSNYGSYSGIESLDGIEFLTNLEILEIDGCHLEEFSLSTDFKKQLKVFRVHNYNQLWKRLIHSNTLIEEMENLEELTWNIENHCELEPILKLNKLKKLSLYCYNIVDLTNLNLLPSDLEIELVVFNDVEGNISIGTCNLKELDIHAKTTIDLGKYPKLEKISLTGCRLENSKLLESSTCLEAVNIYHCEEMNISEIKSIETLEEFNVWGTNIKSGSIALKDLSNLKNFRFSGTNLKELKLENLGQFRYISLDDNKLEKISFINVSGIKSLYLNTNKLQTLTFLENISDSLEEISLENNLLQDLSGLNTCHKLESARLGAYSGSLESLFVLKNVHLNLMDNETLDTNELKYLVEENNFEISCDIKYLRILDPLKTIKDKVLKNKLERFVYQQSMCGDEDKYFTYRSLLNLKDLTNFSYCTKDVPKTILSLACFPGDIKTLEGIEILENLELLSIDFKNNHISLKPLTKLKKLKSIEFKQAFIYDIESLLELKDLETIVLWEVRAELNYPEKFKLLEQAGIKIHCQEMWWKKLLRNLFNWT